MKTLAIVHTTPATLTVLGQIAAELLPGVKVNNYLDDSVLKQINEEGMISAAARFRFHSLVNLAAASKPDAILCACSSVGGMLEEARQFTSVPLIRIDEPMAEEAARRPGSIVVCATVSSTLGPTFELIRRYTGEERKVDALLISEAGKYLNTDKDKYIEIIADNLRGAAESHDTVVLAQASMAEAVKRLPESMQAKFLTSPYSGIRQLKEIL